tara:strand:+ start:109181 stop:109654 length:474 start_codon:yes stop_codon:yes gene_type:complete
MKKQIITILAVLFYAVSGMAQPPHEMDDPSMGGKQKREKIKAMKVEFITTKLDLSTDEAQKFWPVYNEFTDKLMAIEKGRRKMLKENADKELSDAEINKLIAYNFDTDQKILDLKREYNEKFKKVLSVQKVGLLYQSEHMFKRELLHKMRKDGPAPR